MLDSCCYTTHVARASITSPDGAHKKDCFRCWNPCQNGGSKTLRYFGLDDKWSESRFHGRCQSTQSFSCVLFIKKPKGVEKKFLNKQYLQLGSTKEIGGEWCKKNSKVTYEYWSTSYRTLNNSQGEQFSIKE